MQRQLTFDEIIKLSDVIFIGQVTDQQCRYGPNQKMIFTDVCFEVQDVISLSQNAELPSLNEITLTFAGGIIGEQRVIVSDVPSFETGKVYLICTKMDGETYASPIIGSNQGLFHVVKDEISGITYPLVYGNRPISKIINNELVVGPAISRIYGGAMQPAAAGKSVTANFLNEAPKPTAGFKGLSAKVSPPPPIPTEIMNLHQFIVEITKRIE
jgi:hypothetical protein